jgi:CheY-like chemotaxis protein
VSLIVHVDDDASTRELMAVVLSVSGYPWVVSFEDGEAALHYCLRARPALVITDIARPGMDGLTLCHRLRADPALAETRLLIHSAYSASEIGLQAAAVRAGFIPKPCSLWSLVEGVQQALAGSLVWRDSYRAVPRVARLSR